MLNPLMVTPAVSVRIAPQAGITPLGTKSFAVSALVHTEAENGAKGTRAAGAAGGLARRAGQRRHLRWSGRDKSRTWRFRCSPIGWRKSPTR